MYLPLAATEQPSNIPPRSCTQCIVTVTTLLAMVIVISTAVWGAMSFSMATTDVVRIRPNASNEHNPAAGNKLLALSRSGGDTVCETHTGGTCFFLQCNPERHAVCSSTWTKMFWHECNCLEGQCAGLDGRCHDRAFQWTIESSFRKEIYTLFFMGIVMVGRSGLDGYLLAETGLDRVTTVRRKVATKYLTWSNRVKGNTKKPAGSGLTPFDELVAEQHLNSVQAAFICTVKLLLWHVGQVFFYWAAWFAHRQLMGWVQFVFATVVAVKEAWYLLVLAVAVVEAPHFLLCAPLSAPAGRALYLLSPFGFVCVVLNRVPGKKEWLSYVMLPAFSLEWAAMPSAWIALAVGLCGQGVMFPSLCCGYLLAGLSVPAWLHWFAGDQRL